MKCPACNEELVMASRVMYNVDAYGRSATGKAECCGYPIRVVPRRSFELSVDRSGRTEDDWGEQVKAVAEMQATESWK